MNILCRPQQGSCTNIDLVATLGNPHSLFTVDLHYDKWHENYKQRTQQIPQVNDSTCARGPLRPPRGWCETVPRDPGKGSWERNAPYFLIAARISGI